MLSDKSLKEFLNECDKRVANLTKRAANLKHAEFYKAVEDLELRIEGSKVHFYGTRAMQLGHPKSHINMFLEVGTSYLSTQTPENVQKLIEQLEEFFRSEILKNQFLKAESRGEYDERLKEYKLWVGPMRRLKTPVMTLRIFLGQLQCDITFDCGLGVENTKLVQRMFQLQPEAFKLYHFVRIWIHIDEFAFKRYMVALLVIFYMQQKNLLPSVVVMQKDVVEKWIAGWNVGFDHKKSLNAYGMERMTNYKDHLISFFDFYRTFEFNTNVICPYLGHAVPIKSYSSDYKDFQKFGDSFKNFNKQSVNVADLLNLNFNVGFGVGKKRIKKFVPFCGHAIELLGGHVINSLNEE